MHSGPASDGSQARKAVASAHRPAARKPGFSLGVFPTTAPGRQTGKQREKAPESEPEPHAPAQTPPIAPPSLLLARLLPAPFPRHLGTSQRVACKWNNPVAPFESTRGEGWAGRRGGRKEPASKTSSFSSSNQNGLACGGAGPEKRAGVGLRERSEKAAGREGGLPEIKSSQSERAGFIRRAAWGVAAAAARAGGWLRP